MKFLCSAAKIAIYFSFTVLWMALFINASQNNIIKMTDEDMGKNMMLAPKVGDYIQSIEEVEIITKDSKHIPCDVVIKIEEIDHDGDFLVRYGYNDNNEVLEWVSKKDTNKFVNLKLDVFPTGITTINLQGNWVNSLSFKFTVKDTIYTSKITGTEFEIEETENEFICNQWVLIKKSKTLTWKKGNEEVFWYPSKMQKEEIKIKKDKNEHEQEMDVQQPISYFQGNSNEIQSQPEEEAKMLEEEQAKMLEEEQAKMLEEEQAKMLEEEQPKMLEEEQAKMLEEEQAKILAEEKEERQIQHALRLSELINMRDEKEELEMQHALWLSQLSQKESMDWFHNLGQDVKDSVVQLLSQGIEKYGNFNETVVKDVEQKFGINPSQTQQLYEFVYLKEQDEEQQSKMQEEKEKRKTQNALWLSQKGSMDWFHNLGQDVKDSVVQLLSQGIEQYGNFNETVVKDVEQKFGINPSQTQQLYEFVYLKEQEGNLDEKLNQVKEQSKMLEKQEENEELGMQHALLLSQQDDIYLQGNFNEIQRRAEEQKNKLLDEKDKLEMEKALRLSEQEGNLDEKLNQVKEQSKVLEENNKLLDEKDKLEMEKAILLSQLSQTAELTEGILSVQDQIQRDQEQRYTELMDHAQCVLCLETFINPTSITCGHTFCAACLQSFCNAPQNVGRAPCPVCRVEFDTNTNYAVNVEFRNQIEHMNNNNNNANQ